MGTKKALCIHVDDSEHANRRDATAHAITYFLKTSGILTDSRHYVSYDRNRIMAAGRILTPVQMLEEIVSHVRNSLGVQPIYIATNYDGIALGVTEAVQKIAPPSEVVEILTSCYTPATVQKSAPEQGIDYKRLRHIETSDRGVIRKLREVLEEEKGILTPNR